MASVSSLDQDMRNLRMSRYTPRAAKEVRSWIEETLGEQLPPGDLLEALKDGVALCKLVNLVMPSPGVKYKASSMPFIQMENISQFLRACEMPPLSMPSHDRFLTVDLYENKDPAQVLQCLSAFSRQAHAVKPSIVRNTIGPKRSGTPMSPATTGGAPANGVASWSQPGNNFARPPSPIKFSAALPSASGALSPSLTGGSTGSQKMDSLAKSSSGPVSSWSNRKDESITAPAWNIHQYGYMGGASQGNQGISFGARRQITTQAPAVPSLAEKERLRKEKAAEEERRRREAEEAELQRQRESEAEEQRARIEEEQQWEMETERQREEERRNIEEQKRQWAEQERRWKEEEAARRREDAELQGLQKKPPEKPRVPSSSILRGQTLSQYQKEQAALTKGPDGGLETAEQKRVRELEKQLEEAREREKQYQAEREERLRRGDERSRPMGMPAESSKPPSSRQSEQSWTPDEREHLRQQSQVTANGALSAFGADGTIAEVQPLTGVQEPARLPQQLKASAPQPMQPSDSMNSTPSIQSGSEPTSSPLGSSNRPPPTPDKEYQSYLPPQPVQSRTERFLSTNAAPVSQAPRVSSSQEAGDTSLEQARDRDSRIAAQQQTKAGNWASKSLLEREMDRERERQREWEANQADLRDKPRDVSQGTGEGQSWDVNQYGFVGGDSMNRGSSAGSGINFGGRRQILGPREMGSKSKGG